MLEAGLHIGDDAHEHASRGRGNSREMAHEDRLDGAERHVREIAPCLAFLNGLSRRIGGPE
jgi:hypothetical protein